MAKKVWGGLFEVEETEPKKKSMVDTSNLTPQKAPGPVSIPTSSPMLTGVESTSSPAIAPISKEDADKFRVHFEEILDKANLPGPDYYEFMKVEQSLADVVADSTARMKAAYKTLVVQGLTKDKLVNSASQYVGILQKDKEGFQTALKAKLDAEVGGRKQKLADLKKSIDDSKEQIEMLSRAVQQSQNEMATLQSEVVNSEAKLRQNEGVYLSTCDTFITKIQQDIQILTANL